MSYDGSRYLIYYSIGNRLDNNYSCSMYSNTKALCYNNYSALYM